MKYKFGVMSCVWTIEAEDFDVAKMAIILFIRQNIPIAVYEPAKGMIEPLKEFQHNNADPTKVKIALKTIRDVKI